MVYPTSQRYFSIEGKNIDLAINIEDKRFLKDMMQKVAWVGDGGGIYLEQSALLKIKKTAEDSFRQRSFQVYDSQPCEKYERRQLPEIEIDDEVLAKEKRDAQEASLIAKCQAIAPSPIKRINIQLTRLRYEATDEFWGGEINILAEFSVTSSGYHKRFTVLQRGNTDFGKDRRYIERDLSRVFSEFVRQLSSDANLIRALTS